MLYKVRDDDEAAEVEGDWKFAAMVLDRSAGGQMGGQLGDQRRRTSRLIYIIILFRSDDRVANIS